MVGLELIEYIYKINLYCFMENIKQMRKLWLSMFKFWGFVWLLAISEPIGWVIHF